MNEPARSADSKSEAEEPTRARRSNGPTTLLPFAKWWPLLIGAFTGIALRLIFSGKPGGLFSVMEAPFVYLVPALVGAVTVFAAESKRRRTWGYYVWAPALANALFVIGTLAVFIEGLICAVIVLPLFGFIGAIGGLMMGAVCRLTRYGKRSIYSFAALPLLFGALPASEVDLTRVETVERTLIINRSAARIWQEIHSVKDIQPDELNQAWMYRIGVPLPLAGVTEQTPSGPIRRITMGKAVHFDQVATAWQENRHVRWVYRFHPDSFPPQALDDHVMIGGRYFDLIDTEYALQPVDQVSTALKIKMSYRVSTQFNWYADKVARLLIGNFEEVILAFYRARAEN
jgi:hypothetical protein